MFTQISVVMTIAGFTQPTPLGVGADDPILHAVRPKKFDKDKFFNNLIIHNGASEECLTCYADRVRILRNAVHPDCWKAATQKDVDDSRLLIMLIFHALVVCETRLADFQDSPDAALRLIEEQGKTPMETPDLSDLFKLS